MDRVPCRRRGQELSQIEGDRGEGSLQEETSEILTDGGTRVLQTGEGTEGTVTPINLSFPHQPPAVPPPSGAAPSSAAAGAAHTALVRGEEGAASSRAQPRAPAGVAPRGAARANRGWQRGPRARSAAAATSPRQPGICKLS